MDQAIDLAKTAVRVKTGGPFGAIIYDPKNNKIVGQGFNQVLMEKDPTAHAEIVAIRNACKELKSIDLSGMIMYTTGQCCPMCYAACVWSNINKIYYASSVEQATKYGNFRDEEMFEDIQNQPNPELRKIPSYYLQECNANMEEVWKNYSNLPSGERTQY